MTSSSSRSYDLLWMSLALLVLLPIALQLAISPHDYWFYVRTGQDILQAGSIPHIDTLSYTYAGTPLLDQPWLAEVIFWVAYRSGGATLTFLLRVICIGIAYAVVWILLRELGTEPWLATLLTILLGLSSSMNWTVRPQMFAYPLFAVTLWVLWRWQNSRAKHLWLGADARPMAWGEFFTSLQQGLLDAQENPIPIVSTFKLYEVQKFLALTGHVYPPAPVLLSRKSWDRMPSDIQKILLDTAVEVAKIQRQLNRTQEQKQLGELKAKGMTVVEEPDRTVFREAMKPVFEQFQGQLGKGLVQRIVDTK